MKNIEIDMTATLEHEMEATQERINLTVDEMHMAIAKAGSLIINHSKVTFIDACDNPQIVIRVHGEDKNAAIMYIYSRLFNIA